MSRQLRMAQVSLVEWDKPQSADYSGTVADSLSVAMQHDNVDGSVWARVQIGDTWIYVRPDKLEEFAFDAWRMASKFRECRWDLDLMACNSPTCRFEPGPKHVGRL